VARLTGVSPVLLVAELDRAVEFYRDRLGFECSIYGDPPNFVVAVRDKATILLALAADAERIVLNWQIVAKTWDAYIRVDDADAVYAEVQERSAKIDYTIYDAPHGFREFGVQDPDGHDIAFGATHELTQSKLLCIPQFSWLDRGTSVRVEHTFP
jgi:predicted enzyme related to lactoylglutathione lyase